MTNRKMTRAEVLKPNEPRDSDLDERRVSFSFSSEAEVQRYFGTEVLDHKRSSVNLDRLNDSAPLLFNHDPERVIGVVERAWVDDDRRGYADVRFSQNPFASEVLRDVQDGIMRNISVGYQINKMEESEGVMRATDWQPLELSVVAIPADSGIGIGRSSEEFQKTMLTANAEALRISDTKNEIKLSAGSSDGDSPEAPPPNNAKREMSETNFEINEVRAEAAKAERLRMKSIKTLCSDQGIDAETSSQLIDNGATIDEARELVLSKLAVQNVPNIAPSVVVNDGPQRYNFAAGVRAAATGDWSSKDAGFVRELSQECELKGSTRSGRNSFFVPFGAMAQRATYNTGTASQGGDLVEDQYLAGSFVDVLRNNSELLNLGVETMSGLQGNIEIPRQTSSGTAYWLANETTAITQSEATFDQITMTPKHLTGLQKYTRQMVLQGDPGIEQLIRNDLTRSLAIAMDLAILNGSGSSGQPTGILQTSGIGSVAMGTNGGAVTLDAMVDLEREVAIDNALTGTPVYLTNPKVVAGLKKLKDTAGAYLYNVDLQARGRGATPGVINGYGITGSTNVPSNLTKGSGSNLSAVLFGDFSSCMVGVWGPGLEITVGENEDDFAKVLTSVRATMHMDVALRHPESFAAILDVVAA